MNLTKFLEHGYFPKELPPPFETVSFAKKSRYINSKWNSILRAAEVQRPNENAKKAKARVKEEYVEKYGSSDFVVFSLAKGIFSRRKLGIPNPKQYLDLSNSFIENWDLLIESSKMGDYSLSYPVQHDADRSVRTKSKTLNDFKFELINQSFNHNVELRLDISQFYPSIYTHSIPWSLLGKEKAKKYFRIKKTQTNNWASLLTTDQDARKYRIADHIDTMVRNCNERQSVGLPIGPDTSFILAECVGSRIDLEIKKQLKDIDHHAVRFYDDYHFYLNSVGEAEIVLKKVQQVLHKFKLETNESKVHITTLPLEFSENWATELSKFNFFRVDKFTLRTYFSILFDILKNNKKQTSWIVSYALGRFVYGHTRIPKDSWDLFLTFLLQIVHIDPSNLDEIFKIIVSYKLYLNIKSKERISQVLHKLIPDHLALRHTFEVSWCLWIFKSLNLKCSRDILNEVLKSNDSCSKLICLDLIDSSLYSGRKPGLTKVTANIKKSDLFSDSWLFAYESYKKGWLDFKTRNLLDEHEFMQILKEYDVEFYNPDNRIDTEFVATVGSQRSQSGGMSEADFNNVLGLTRPNKRRKPRRNIYTILDKLLEDDDTGEADDADEPF